MSADSLRKGVARMTGAVVRPQPVSEKTFMESVAGLINEVGLVTQPYASNEEKENTISWTKFELCKNNDLKFVDSGCGSEHTASPPLLLTVGYHSGIQMWAIPMSGEAQEIFSWRRSEVRSFQLLPTPDDMERDQYRAVRPIVAITEGANFPSSPNHLTFISLRSGECLKSTKFVHPICDVLANSIAVVVSFLDKILVLDPYKFETRVTIASSGSRAIHPGINPIALGSNWLAYTDQKLVSVYQSLGGVENAGAPSYTATMLYAAKSLTKGLKGLGETVASSITGYRVSSNSETTAPPASEPGIVTIVNLSELKPGEFSLGEGNVGTGSLQSAVVAHFVAHMHNPVLTMNFDPSGMLLVTADKEGHDFHVFRIHPHPLGSSMGAVHHLYVLHRGDTGAKVQNISFAPDSRWVAVSTLRGTTHIFPVTPYGGAISVRTHTSHRVVNRLSRFHRTAGLDDTPTSGRNSPVMTFNPNGTSSTLPGGKSFDLLHLGSPYPNPRLPSFPHPVVVHPLAQLRQSFISVTSSPKGSPPIGKSKAFLPLDDRTQVVSMFDAPRGWLANSPAIVPSCDKRRKSPIEALFVMTCHGNLVEYNLDPKPAAGCLKDKVSDDMPIELAVHARAQWNFPKPKFSKELQSPLSPSGFILLPTTTTGGTSESNELQMNSNDSQSATDTEENGDEHWLSQVEITTHSGPHRRLWMGPQFSFKIFSPSLSSSSSKPGLMDVETVEVNVTNRPAKSNPVNMPVSSSLLPVVIEGSSGSSLEQSPRLVDPYGEGEAPVTTNDSQIKENLAEAMMENCAVSSRGAGGCQSLESCDDLSSSSFDSTSQTSMDAPIAPSFCIDATLPFPD